MSTKFLYFFHSKGHFRRFLTGLAILALFAGMGAIFVPQAKAATFSCTGATANGNLFVLDTISNQISNASGTSVTLTANGSGTANSDPFTSGACAGTLGIVGQVLCFFKTTIGQIVSTMYCNFQNELLVPISIAIELFIVVLGIFFITGMTNFTVREAMTALIKTALVWAFAMNATWGIGIAYSFFMGLAEQGANLVLNAAGGSGSGGTFLTQPDKVIGSVFNYATVGSGAGPVALPSTLTTFCGLMLFTFFAILFIALPMVAGAILAMIIQYIWLYARALLGYLTALVLIGFLFILAPLFISFALFQTTRSIFDQWIKYLTSFSLQMVIVFAFLALLGMIPLGDFFTEILNLVREYDVTWTAGGTAAFPVTMCSVCKYTINTALTLGNGAPYPVSCAAGNAVIPIDQLFTSQDLVQTIVSQVTALWIIGNIMLDFIKKAPEYARELTGRMPSTALLGNAMPGMGESGGINYGLESIDRTVEGLSNKLTDPGTYKGWKRLAPAAALMAPAFGSLFKRYSAQNANAASNASGSTPSSYETANNLPLANATGQSLAALGKKAAVKTANALGGTSSYAATNDAAMMGASFTSSSSQQPGSGQPAVPRTFRLANFAKPLVAARYALANDQHYQVVSREKADIAYANLKHLVDQEKAGLWVDPAKLALDKRLLAEAGDMHWAGMLNLETSKKQVMNELVTLREKAPDASVGSVPSISQQRDQAKQTLADLQLQVSIRQILTPAGRLQSAQSLIDQAHMLASNPNAQAETLKQIEDLTEEAMRVLV